MNGGVQNHNVLVSGQHCLLGRVVAASLRRIDTCVCMTKQKAYVIQSGSDGIKGLDELNVALGRGWRVVATTPFGGAAAADSADRFCVACLVVVEREDRPAAALVDTAEEEDIVDELIEGDGSNGDVDTDL